MQYKGEKELTLSGMEKKGKWLVVVGECLVCCALPAESGLDFIFVFATPA
jgi:hypothetical protein